MKKLLILTAIALAVGLSTGYWLGSESEAPALDPRFLETRPHLPTSSVRTVSAADAEAARRASYKGIGSIASVMALPTHFARREALMVLAGRSNSAELQDLLFQALSIDDTADRAIVIRTLLERLVEVDPKSAVAIADSPVLAAEGQFTQQTWYLWARHDFRAAMEEASKRERDAVRIAQALYTAMPIPEQAIVDQIRLALGHRPNRQTISYWMRSIYQESPREAAAFVAGLARRDERFGAVRSMAYYLANRPQGEAMQFAGMLSSAELQKAFENTLTVQIATNDPVRALQMVLNDHDGRRNTAAIEPAMRHLVATDPGQLDAIIAQLSERDQRIAISVAATTMAETDPDRALDWIRARDEPDMGAAINDVLMVIAKTDSDRAISEALRLPRRSDRDSALGSIARAMLADDPVRAMAVLEEISDPASQTMQINQTLLSWIRRDADRAIGWYNSLPDGKYELSLGEAVQQLAWNQPETAARILPALSPEDARTGRQAIAEALSNSEGFDASMRFVDRFASEEDYPDLKRQAYVNLAQQEPNRALQLIQQEADRGIKDPVLAAVAGSIANYDPRQALAVAGQVESQAEKSQAHRSIAQSWMTSDPRAAVHWISSQPAGSERDALLTTAAYSARHRDAAYLSGLMRQIADPGTRQSAVTNIARQAYMQSPDKARNILREAGVTADERAELEKQFERMKAQRYRSSIYRFR